jgi:hypothetical protein
MQLATDGSARGTYVVCLDCGRETLSPTMVRAMRLGAAHPVKGNGVTVEPIAHSQGHKTGDTN